jgi:hypothetical protein
MTGRGEGYCVLELPEPDRPVRGYVGPEGAPVRLEAPAAWPAWGPPTAVRRGLAFGSGGGWGARRRRGRRLPR